MPLDAPQAGQSDWLDDVQASPVAQRLVSCSYPAGTTIFREGEPGDTFLFIVSGDAEVRRADTVVAHLGAGSVVGELALLTGTSRTTTVVAGTRLIGRLGTALDFADLLESDSIRAHFTHLAASRLAANVKPVAFSGKSGFLGELRPLLPTDRPEYTKLISRLSPESRRRRFFTATVPSPHLIDYLLNVDFVDHFAWVALDRSTDPHQGCGIARFIRNDVDIHSAEAAFAVVDSHQGIGIGTTMLGALAVAAEASAITTFTAEVLDDNTPMRKVFEKVGAIWTRPDRGILRAEMSVADTLVLLDPALRDALVESSSGIGLAASTALRLTD